MTDKKQMNRLNNLLDKFISWVYVTRIWGPRCHDVEPECIVCSKWIEHDELFNSTGEIKLAEN